MSNPIDLTTIANVQGWISSNGPQSAWSATELQIIQDCITAFSLYVLQLTGRGNADGSVPTASPFVTPVAYDEFYDGNGNDQLPLNNWPITAVAAVIDTGYTIPQSTSTTSPGWVVDQSHKFIVLRYGGTLYSRGWRGRGGSARVGFTLGTQNIEVQYTAGFNGIPFDLEMLARKIVGLNYRRRGWIGQKSQAMAMGAGTVNYGTWEMDDQDQRVLAYYMTRAA